MSSVKKSLSSAGAVSIPQMSSAMENAGTRRMSHMQCFFFVPDASNARVLDKHIEARQLRRPLMATSFTRVKRGPVTDSVTTVPSRGEVLVPCFVLPLPVLAHHILCCRPQGRRTCCPMAAVHLGPFPQNQFSRRMAPKFRPL